MSTTAREQLWSRTGVEAVINAPGLSHQQRDYVMRLRSALRHEHKIDKDTLKLSVVYERSAHGGRRWEKGYRGLQGASRIVRRLCSAMYYTDWDIENAACTLLEGKLKAAGIPCPVLSGYVAHREPRLSAVVTELGVTRELAKELVLVSLHGGNWKNQDYVPARATHHSLDALAAEIRAAVLLLAALPEHVPRWNTVQNDPDKHNKMGSFVSLVWQDVEDAAITAAEEFLLKKGAPQVDVLTFDGVMSRNDQAAAAIDPVEMSRYVSGAIGTSIVMREKPFALLPSDLQVLHPDDVQRVLGVSGLSAEQQRVLLEAMGEPIVLETDFQADFPEEITEEHADERVSPYYFGKQTRMVLIGASMALGKTYQLHSYLEKNPHLKRVAIITARQQQAYSAQGVFEDIEWSDGSSGFTNYLDHPDGSLRGFDKIVIQDESLHRLCDLNGDIEPYDLIIIDEIRSVFTQAQSVATHGQRLLLNYEILEGVIKTSRTIGLDADMEVDGAVWELVSKLLPKESISFHRYTHVALHREIIVVSEPECLRRIGEDLAGGKRIGAPFRSKMKMDDVLGMKEVAPYNKLQFNSDSTKQHMEKLKNIDSHLDDVQLLSFTSKVTTAIDIQTPIDTVYVHAKAVTGPTPRDTLQMIGRFRNVTSGQVVCVLPAIRNTALDVTYESERRAILQRKDLAISMQQVLAARGMVREGSLLSFLPHPLLGLTAHARVERNSCFTTSFHRQVLRKGWRIRLHFPDDSAAAGEMKDSLAAVHAQSKAERAEHKLQVAEEVQEMTPKKREEEVERLRRLNRAYELGPADRVKKNTLHVATRLPPDRVAELDLELLVFAADDLDALDLTSAVMRDAQEDQSFSDATALAQAPAGEHAKYREAASRAIRDVVRLMGFSGPCDTDTRVSLREFLPSERQGLTDKCEEVFNFLKIVTPRVKKNSPQKHITLARNVLRLVKIKLRSKRLGKGRTSAGYGVTEYWLASECEGFFELVEDLNPCPGDPTNPSKVPYSQRTRIVNVLKSHAVVAISARELSRVDPLPVAVPWQPEGFVLASLVPYAGSLTHAGHPSPLAFADQRDAELAEPQANHAAEEESADEMAGLGCYADDQVESADEMGLGCYIDGASMQDDSDCCVDD
jgi:hypothetical protein